MSEEWRAAHLTTIELHRLDRACQVIRQAFGTPPYLVGSAGIGAGGSGYRDVDVRLMLSPEQFKATCPTKARWEALCLAFTAWLCMYTGLPVDFQIQDSAIANDKHDKMRNPLGTGRAFAGGGDATPDWESA